MKVTGARKLRKQLAKLRKITAPELEKTIQRTVDKGVTEAKALVPVATGELRDGIHGVVGRKEDKVFGFINFYGGDFKDGLRANSINYGWPLKNTNRFAHSFRKTVKGLIADRHKNTAKSAITRAMKKATK